MSKIIEEGIRAALFFFFIEAGTIVLYLLTKAAGNHQDVWAYLRSPSLAEAFNALWVPGLFVIAFALIGVALFASTVLFDSIRNSGNSPANAG